MGCNGCDALGNDKVGDGLAAEIQLCLTVRSIPELDRAPCGNVGDVYALGLAIMEGILCNACDRGGDRQHFQREAVKGADLGDRLPIVSRGDHDLGEVFCPANLHDIGAVILREEGEPLRIFIGGRAAPRLPRRTGIPLLSLGENVGLFAVDDPVAVIADPDGGGAAVLPPLAPRARVTLLSLGEDVGLFAVDDPVAILADRNACLLIPA